MEHSIFSISKSNKVIILIGIFAFYCGLSGCKEIIATNLTGKSITVLAPQDNAFTTAATVTFYWEELEGARSYRLQIAKPSFDNMISLMKDTLITQTQFSVVLTPGVYQWRIRGENGSTETPYVTRTITIDSTSDLSAQEIILINPAHADAVNTTSFTANWFGLYNASQYRLSVRAHTSGFGGSLIVPDVLVTDTFVTVSGLTEGYLDWGVRGESNLNTTTYKVRNIYIDLTNPLAPALNTPAHAATIPGPDFTLTWTNGTDTGSPLSDSVYIYADASYNTLRKSYRVNGTTTLTDTIADGTWYWRIKAVDKAGNTSPFSVTRSFTVN